MQIMSNNSCNIQFGMALYMPSRNELLNALSKRSVEELEKARPRLMDLSKDIDVFISAKQIFDNGLTERVSYYIQDNPLSTQKSNNLLINIYNKFSNYLSKNNKSHEMVFEDKYIKADRIISSLKASKYIKINSTPIM